MAATIAGAALSGELTTLAVCWRLVRRDGIALGFTTHDRPLLIGGMRFDSAPGMVPSAIIVSDSIEVDTMEIGGALNASGISVVDLAAGRYDGATVRLFLIDWRDPGAGQHLLASGTLGAVQAGSGPDCGFSATLRGPTAALAAARIETFSPECRAALGDRRCRVSMRGRVVASTIVAAAGETMQVMGLDELRAPDFVAGRVRIVDGPMAGIERLVLAAEGALLRLDEPLAVLPGTGVEVREGCDRRFVTCCERFANAVNFRAEPHVPGGDILTRFGGL